MRGWPQKPPINPLATSLRPKPLCSQGVKSATSLHYAEENRCDFLYKRAFHLGRERKRKGRVNIAIILHLRESKSYFACHYSR